MSVSNDDSTCPACGQPGATTTGLTAEEHYELLACGACGTQFFVDVLATSSDTTSHYKWENYKLDLYSDEAVRRGFESRYEQLVRRARAEIGPLESVLDIGCGIGNFVEFAKGHGLDAVGTDVSLHAVAEARRRGLQVYTADELPTAVPDASVDALTMWDVIEHVSTPKQMLESVIVKLRRGGALLFETPDGGFPIRRWLLELNRRTQGRANLTGPMYYWEHKIYLTESGMRRLLDSVGVELVHVERQTSVRAKMKREFAEKQSKKGRALKYTWPLLESAFRRAGHGNKLLVIGRRR